MAKRQQENKGINEIRYTASYLGTASLSFVSNDYGFFYELMRK